MAEADYRFARAVEYGMRIGVEAAALRELGSSAASPTERRRQRRQEFVGGEADVA